MREPVFFVNQPMSFRLILQYLINIRYDTVNRIVVCVDGRCCGTGFVEICSYPKDCDGRKNYNNCNNKNHLYESETATRFE